MNTEYYNELKDKIEKWNYKNVGVTSAERKISLTNLMNSNFTAYADKNVAAIIAFYEYTKDRDEFDYLNEHYTRILSSYFSRESIDKDFDYLISPEGEKTLKALVSLGNDDVRENLITIAYRKALNNQTYKPFYDSLCQLYKQNNIKIGNILDLELSKDDKIYSKKTEDLLKSLESFNKPVEVQKFEAQKPDNHILESFEARVEEAKKNINDAIAKEGAEPISFDKPLDKSVNLNSFSSDDVNSEEREKRYDEMYELRKQAKENVDNIVHNNAKELNVSDEAVSNVIKKSGFTSSKIDTDTIVISELMESKIASRESIAELTKTQYGKFITKLFDKLQFKAAMKEFTVSELDKKKKIIVKPGTQFQRIAKAEKRLLSVQRLSQSIKKMFVDTKNNVTMTIKHIFDKQNKNTDAIEETNENSISDVETSSKGFDLDINSSENKEKLREATDLNKYKTDIPKLKTLSKSEVIELLSSMQNKNVIGDSGALVTSKENHAQLEAARHI